MSATILQMLKDERNRLDEAINVLERKGPVATTGRRGPRRRRHMSAEARKKIGDMMRKRWAERKRKAKAA